MVLDQIEIHWRAGGEWHVLVIDEEGRPTLDGHPAKRLKPGPPRRGQAWTEDEEYTLALRLTTVEDAALIATELGRSRGAVLARAVKLGLLDESQVSLRYRAEKVDDQPF